MISKLLYILKHDITVNKIVIFVFLFIYCGCYYKQYLSIISLSYLLLGLTFVYNMVRHKKIIHLQFIFIALLFVLYCIFSSLWAVNFDLSYNASMQLFKSVFVSVLFITLIDSRSTFKWALFSFSLAGIIYSILYLQNVDIASLGANRIGSATDDSLDLLPNVNTVGLFLSFSFVYFLYCYFSEKRSLYIVIIAFSFVVIFILGARKSILSLCFCLVMLMHRLKVSSRIKIVILCCAFIVLLFVYVPSEYLIFVSERLAQLNFFSNKISDLDESDSTRILLLESGFMYGLASPILGNGYYSFSQLLLKDYGFSMYSHNNLIETFVGGGIIGVILYYSLYYVVLKKCYIRNKQIDIPYLLFILMMVLLFNHFSIVVLQERFIWILLSILYVGAKYCANTYADRFSCR